MVRKVLTLTKHTSFEKQITYVDKKIQYYSKASRKFKINVFDGN